MGMGVELESNYKSIFKINNKREIELYNGSMIRVVTSSPDALKGYQISLLIFDEAAFIYKGEHMLTTTLSMLSTGAECIMLSTPNGHDPLFNKTYMDATLGKNEFRITNINWLEDPRFNKDTVWKFNDGDEFKDIPTKNGFIMILMGYKPTSPWYEAMCINLNNNTRHIAQEIGAEFVF